MIQDHYILEDPNKPDSKRIKRKEVDHAKLDMHRNELPIKVESAGLISNQHVATADEYLEDFSGMFNKLGKKGQGQSKDMTKNEIRTIDQSRTEKREYGATHSA